MAADSPINSAEKLIEGILAGLVPRQVRLFAARGLLPVSREDLFRLQLVLSADPDPELAATAVESLSEVSAQVLIEWIRNQVIAPLELDLLARVRREQVVWIAIAQHRGLGDETLRMLASNGDEMVQDIIITNQTRVLDCLEVLEDLKTNPQVSKVVLRRVREFEEEFIEKVAADLAQEFEGDGKGSRVSIQGALDALRAIGAHLPREAELPVPQDRDHGIEDKVLKANESALGRLLNLSVKEKILVAMRGSREERSILINSRNRLVMRAVLASPKVNDGEIERFAGSKSVSEEVVRVIAENNRWLRHYPVLLAVVQNPKAPVQKAIRLMSNLSFRDLNRLSMDRNVNPIIRRQAKTRIEKMRR
ncbi:MAG: hypothetical protein DRJ61_04980 [Acidobacteria bacterium]|nr:MAG: hypothetical protein DRJ61_04980 [Acidobacteriota bacterium]